MLLYAGRSKAFIIGPPFRQTMLSRNTSSRGNRYQMIYLYYLLVSSIVLLLVCSIILNIFIFNFKKMRSAVPV